MTDPTEVLPARQVLHTTCTLDCPDTCSLAVTVELGDRGDHRDRRIVDIDAAPGNPLTDGWICAKVKQHMRRVYAPERVRTPLVRTGPKGSGEFRVRVPSAQIATRSVVGGALMGIGAALAGGCTIGNAMVETAQFTYQG